MEITWKVKEFGFFCNVGQNTHLSSTGKSRICYVMLGEQIPEVHVLENGKSFKKVFMVEAFLLATELFHW